MLKRDNADDKIDKYFSADSAIYFIVFLILYLTLFYLRQLVTNVFLQFVSIQRGDAKKYEVLQLIASVLDWSDGTTSLSLFSIKIECRLLNKFSV
jgi:hypothetical protein